MFQPNTHLLALMASILAPLAFASCPAVDDIDDGGNENEVITRVALTFRPNGGGADVGANVDAFDLTVEW